MARREVTQFFDDLDGELLPDNAVRTIEFSYSNAHYVIDLSAKHAEEFEKVMEPWIEKGHRVTRPSRAFYKRPQRRDLPLVRKWLREANMEVSDKGRIPQHLLDMYDNRDK